MSNRMRGQRWWVWGLAVALGLTGCLFGGGSETNSLDGGGLEAAIAGRVVSSSGKPVEGALLKLFPSDYDPTTPGDWIVRTTLTDSSGRYAFVRSSASGLFDDAVAFSALYSVVVRSFDGLSWAMEDSQRVNGPFDTLRLSAPRRLEVAFQRSDSAFGIRIPGVSFVPGTDIVVRLENSDTQSIDSLPVGASRMVFRFGELSTFEVQLPLVDTGAGPVHGDAPIDTLRIKSYPDGPGVEP